MTKEEAKREILFAKREVIADSWIDKAYDVAIKALEEPEVIRCKNCKYLLPKGTFCSKDMCSLRGIQHYRSVNIHNDYCSWAKRREDE